MKIGEIAQATGVATSRIRFYEAEGLIPAASRAANGYRDYPPETVHLIRFIGQAQGLGFSLKEIVAANPTASAHPVSCRASLAPLRRKLDDIDAHIAESMRLRTSIVDLIATLENTIAQNSN